MIKVTPSAVRVNAFHRAPSSFDNEYIYDFDTTASREGAYDPLWRSKIKSLQNATTPLKAYASSIVANVGKLTYTNGTPNIEDSTWILNFLPIQSNGIVWSPDAGFRLKDQSLVSEAQASARGKAYNKVYSLQRGTNNQIFLGELRETVDLLRHPFEKSVKLIHAFGDEVTKRNFKTFSKASADSWLEFRFAILPLISDIKAIIALINGKNNLEKLGYRYYAKAESVSFLPNDLGSFAWYPAITNGYDKMTAECIIHFGVVSERIHFAEAASDRLIDSISDLSDIPSTIWEITPWSFLIDYFVNIGDIILASTTGTQILSYTSESNIYTQERNVILQGFGPAYGVGPTNPKLVLPGSLSVFHRSVDRSGGSLAIPPLSFSLPGGGIRLTNIAALLTKFL